MKKLITRVLLPIIAGFSFTLAADSVHAITPDKVIICKSVSDYTGDTKTINYYKGLIEGLTVSQSFIDTFEGNADRLINIAPYMAKDVYHNCYKSMIENKLK